MRIIRFFARLIGNFMIGVTMLVLLMAGMGLGGFFLLDYLIQGETVAVPRVVGMTKAKAIETLTEAELQVAVPIDEVIDEETPPDIVIEQWPYPNSSVKIGRRIQITVSQGPRLAMIPDAVGGNENDVGYDLRSAHLNINQRAAVFNSLHPEGEVLAQDPEPGARLVPEKAVSLLVSLGPKPPDYVMPNYVGMDIDDVLDPGSPKPFQLSKESVSYTQTNDPSQWGRVLEQRPNPGARVASGERVLLTVASSGQKVVEQQIVHIRFQTPPPTTLHPDERLALLIWDSRTTDPKSPTIVPVDIKNWETSIDMWAPVFGNARVVLSAIASSTEAVTYRELDEQKFEFNQ